MFYTVLSTTLWTISALLALIALRSVVRGTWFWSIFRAFGLVATLGAAILIALVGWDLKHYQQLNADKTIAAISFEQVGKQTFVAKLVRGETGVVQEFYLRGDQWQVDARVIRWKGIGSWVGAKPGYRLDRISGRYFSVADEMRKDRTVYSLLELDSPLDIWGVVYKRSEGVPVIEATYGSATYLPMADGAEYQIKLSNTGILATPANRSAQNAVQMWLN